MAPKIPGYELLSRLGGGLLTHVFSARERDTDRPCAVKLLRAEWQDQPIGIKLLQREARAGLAVQHPHLVRLLETHVTRPPYFLVMELLPGESLRRRLRRDYQLDLAPTLWIIRQSAEALAALHRAGFVHGDVKPDNIRLVDDGTAKLIDLGFAHRPGENAALLRQGYLLGTADYLAPERCALSPGGDQRSDLFSLGVTLFETLTGHLPYPPGSTARTLRRHRCDPPADIRKYVNFWLPELGTLVERLLSHEPEKRPRASAVVQHLVRMEIAALNLRRAA
ncbi:MAG TPA: serine/threonine-protein kinase [Gemmataceae bacterium]|nr:serine/threonine-protein kinase [Gemmataceae bacterium]